MLGPNALWATAEPLDDGGEKALRVEMKATGCGPIFTALPFTDVTLGDPIALLVNLGDSCGGAWWEGGQPSDGEVGFLLSVVEIRN